MGRKNSGAVATEARPLTPEEEDEIGAALDAEEAQDTQEPETPPQPAAPPLPPTPIRSGQTLSAKQRQEAREEQELEENQAEWQRALSAWAIPGAKYTYDLMRLKPVSWKDPETGLTYLPGKDDGRGKFIQSYVGEDPPPLSEIENVHGGEEYVIIAKGPDPKDPKRTATKRVKFSILGAPKTVGTPQGALPMGHATQYGIPPPVDNSSTQIMTTVMTMLEKTQAQSRADMMQLVQTLQKSNTPVADPAAERRWKEEQDEKRRSHEERLAKEKTEADERRERERIEREERREEARLAREAAEKAEQRRHEKEMKLLEQQSEARRADEKQRREDDEKREKRHAELLKESRESMEKLVEKITKKEEAPEDRILKTMQLIETVRGDKEKPAEDGPISRAIEKMVPEVSSIAKMFISRMEGSGGGGGKPNPAPRVNREPTVVAIDAPSPEADAAKPVAQEQPEEELPPFEWPVEGDDVKAISTKFGGNVEKALVFKWDHKRIYQDVVLKFPPEFLAMLRSLPIEAITDAIESNSPPDAQLRTPRGKLTLKLIYRALTKSAAEEAK